MFIVVITTSLLFTFFMSTFQWHKVLRNETNYKIFVSLSILLPLAMLVEDLSTESGTINFLVSFGPFIFLILYNFFDRIIFKKFNRRFFFIQNILLRWSQ